MYEERKERLRRAKEHWRYVAMYLGPTTGEGERSGGRRTSCSYASLHPRKCAMATSTGEDSSCHGCAVVLYCWREEIKHVLDHGRRMHDRKAVVRAKMLAERTFVMLRRAHKHWLLYGELDHTALASLWLDQLKKDRCTCSE